MTPEAQNIFSAGIGALILTAVVVGVYANIRFLKLRRKLARPTMQKEEPVATEWSIYYGGLYVIRTNGVRWQVKHFDNQRIGGTLAQHVEDMKAILLEQPDAEFDNREPMYFILSWWVDTTVDNPAVQRHLEEAEVIKNAQKKREEEAIEFLRRTRPEVLKGAS